MFPAFCGVREMLGDGSAQRKLPTLDPSWFFAGAIAGIAEDVARETIQAALAAWSKHCAIRWTEARNSQEATLKIITTRIDGPGNVLADCQLPYPQMDQLLMRLDNEKFVAALNPPSQRIGLQHVVSHEGGHALGIMHLPFDNTPDLMNATYSPQVYEPQADDGTIARKLYGAPRVAEEPIAPAPGKPWKVTITDGQSVFEANGVFRKLA